MAIEPEEGGPVVGQKATQTERAIRDIAKGLK